jgi:hypothetical protein
MLQIRPLTLANFADFATLTACGDDGAVCYCSFWHVKVASFAEYTAMKEDPTQLRDMMRARVQAGFHVGALAYDVASDARETLVAWISVAPLPEQYWCWKRAAALGVERAATTAGITCLTLAAGARGQGMQRHVAVALREYGRARGWTAIEAYPFDDAAIAASTKPLAWPGFARPYVEAGYARTEAHWLSKPGSERWIHRAELSASPEGRS